MDPFVWDAAKDAENRAKHGVGLDIVRELDWSAAIIRQDRRYDYGEERFYAVARILGLPYYVVIVPRDGTIRVLSARRMHEKEAKHHGI